MGLKRFCSTHPKSTFVLSLLVLTILCVGVSVLIVTEREQVNSVISRTAMALEEGDAQTVMGHVAADFQQEGLDYAALRVYVHEGLNRYGPPSITVISREFEIADGKATCTLKMFSSFPQHKGWEGSTVSSTWHVALKKIGKEWRITRVVPTKISGYTPGGLTDLRRHGRH